MLQLFAIALGGSFGAVLRFLVASCVYQWLGKDFPYGTLAVNIIGSFLLGLMTEAFIVQKVTVAFEYRSAILIGFIGAFTTFSTFALETVYLLEQGSLIKALVNILASVSICVVAVWIGLTTCRILFSLPDGVFIWQGYHIPYALLVINTIGAFLIGFIASIIINKTAFPEPLILLLFVVVTGCYLIFSGLYILFFLLERDYTFAEHSVYLIGQFGLNAILCITLIWLGHLAGKDI
jgi:CrcB protein